MTIPSVMTSRISRRSSGDALHSALARLLREAGDAVRDYDKDPESSAHFVRTRVKRLQALGRLVPAAGYWRKEFLRPLREMKDLFGAVRDATILRALAEKFAPAYAVRLVPPARPDLSRAALLVETATRMLPSCSEWSEVERRKVADRAACTYRAARKAWKAAARRNVPDAAFHEWRRRVKRLFFQCEFLGGGVTLARITRRADRLGEVLGEIQDVCVAEDWLSRNCGLTIPADLPRSKEEIRGEALRLGRVLFSPKPRDFRRMLG